MKRIHLDKASWHVIMRGVRRLMLFRDDADRAAYIRILDRALKRHPVALHAFVLMDNHTHLLLSGSWDALGALMHDLNRLYAAEPVLGRNDFNPQGFRWLACHDADAGIIPLSLAVQHQDEIRYVLIDDKLHTPLRQAAAVLKQSKHADVARAFLDYLKSPPARDLIAQSGYDLP